MYDNSTTLALEILVCVELCNIRVGLPNFVQREEEEEELVVEEE